MLGSTVVHGLFATEKYSLKLRCFFFLATAISDRLISSSFNRRNKCLKDKFVIAAVLKMNLFFNLPCVRESTAYLKHHHNFRN